MKKLTLIFYILFNALLYSNSDLKPFYGTSLQFVPELDFSLAKGYIGYESLDYKTIILLMELDTLPQSSELDIITDFNKAYTKEILAKKGLSLISKEIIKNKALLLKAETIRNNTLYYQWIYIFPNNDNKISQVQVSGPKESFSKIEKNILTMLDSLTWSSEKFEEKL